ncbi:hypothetical protein [Leuconostoc mesenteroides]|uniref:hypothetical protein n=1 Tax=Leuconostoc mesenteroides TaxID=1245 RepID=UPI0023620EA6|nr:hypothetical protein [Leuconostoc mesenteroides]
MTDPVAYMWKTAGGNVLGFQEYKENTPYPGYAIPLYTAEQLQPRVKMTQAEFDEFKKLLSVGISTIYEAFDVINSDRGEMNEFEQLYNRLFTNGVNEQAKNQIEFSKLWDSLSTSSTEETIEIVPDMKWFVRSKEKYQGFYMFLGNLNELRDPWIFTKQDNFTPFATEFDTKEEAEKWTNPLTEAVQLPVEGE